MCTQAQHTHTHTHTHTHSHTHTQLFVKDNQGGEETSIIHHIGIHGNPIETTKMSEFKRVAGEKGERH